ncbi:RNA polymerase sigma factor [Echinicola sediminis]
MSTESKQLVEQLFRKEYGKLLASLVRFFGTQHIALAEDVVQETLIAALEHWAVEGTPENPPAWLMQVAKRKAFNELKRQKIRLDHQADLIYQEQTNVEEKAVFLEEEIKDNQLRMIFTCCHPSLSVESQIALTLKTLCGFGVKEVAKALLSTESTINKRLYRAKEAIRSSSTPFDIPHGRELDGRLQAVSLTLYLMFNEGYNASSGDIPIQKGLCLEAIRLTKLLKDHFSDHKRLSALLALMCFHTARFEARIDVHGAIILFEDQNRDLWDRELINMGMQYLASSFPDEHLSAYHIEAQIAAEHCLASGFENTDWVSIYHLYELLEKIKPSPVVELNLAIILSRIEGLEASLEQLDALSKRKAMSHYHLLPATQGSFLLKLKRYEEALPYFEQAITLKPSAVESEMIQKQITICKEKLPKTQ